MRAKTRLKVLTVHKRRCQWWNAIEKVITWKINNFSFFFLSLPGGRRFKNLHGLAMRLSHCQRAVWFGGTARLLGSLLHLQRGLGTRISSPTEAVLCFTSVTSFSQNSHTKCRTWKSTESSFFVVVFVFVVLLTDPTTAAHFLNSVFFTDVNEPNCHTEYLVVTPAIRCSLYFKPSFKLWNRFFHK